jgi:hypothetical protein
LIAFAPFQQLIKMLMGFPLKTPRLLLLMRLLKRDEFLIKSSLMNYDTHWRKSMMEEYMLKLSAMSKQ